VKNTTLLIFLVFLAFLYGCSHPPQRVVSKAFYFWRTVFDMSGSDQKELMNQGISRLYTRFFDVLPDPITQKPSPVQDIRFLSPVDSLLEIVPVVFISNETLLHLADTTGLQLGELISTRIRQIVGSLAGQHLKEVQLDCDWTETTRSSYFNLLRAVRERFRKDHALVSATIRLHQIKYFRRTGVPPVDRGMLMFYNMGKLDDPLAVNSIYDPVTASRYLVNFSEYPLPLDIVLPCFSWAVVTRNGHTLRLIPTEPDAPAKPNADLERMDDNHFRVVRETTAWNTGLHPGELIRLEKVDARVCDQAARQIEPCLKEKNIHVAIYHLKKNKISADEKQAFETIYHRFD
jgi:hypothetical protein